MSRSCSLLGYFVVRQKFNPLFRSDIFESLSLLIEILHIVLFYFLLFLMFLRYGFTGTVAILCWKCQTRWRFLHFCQFLHSSGYLVGLDLLSLNLVSTGLPFSTFLIKMETTCLTFYAFSFQGLCKVYL